MKNYRFLFLALLPSFWAGTQCLASEVSGPHWAYVKPQPPQRPVVTLHRWPRNDIDYFVLHRLEELGLAPSPAADKPTLIRRVTLDLTGVPPTPADVEAFLKDDHPLAYERVVDRLLQSPEYAERMTAWWLDMARYADTQGYEGDGARSIWLYRDWVIDAFQRHMPFDQFTVQQLAGDLLPGATLDQRIATGFHRNTPFCYEAGTDLEQFRVESVVDRVNTTMTVWMGTTMGCAQCHDHKYDPISQQEYYQLYAFFNNSAETSSGGTISAASPLHRARAEELKRNIARLQNVLQTPTPELRQAQRKWEADYARSGRWKTWTPDRYESLDGATMELLADRSILVTGKNPDHDTYVLQADWDGRPVAAIGLEVLRDDRLPHGGPGRYDANGNFGLSDFRVEFAAPRTPDTWERISFARALATYEEGQDKAAGAIDEEVATNWCTNQRAGQAVFVADAACEIPRGAQIRIRMKHQSRWPMHGVGRFRVWSAAKFDDDGNDSAPQLPFALLTSLGTPEAERTDQLQQELTNYYLSISPILEPVRRQIAEAKSQMPVGTTMVMREATEPRETRFLLGGSFLTPDYVVQQGVPAIWHAWPGDHPKNRLGLARWIMHAENPLVSRVTMNRIWAMLFGRGLVKTSEDFGRQGAPPTHPALLDFLATSFVASGWHLQDMQRRLVTSSTYRQSSNVTEELLERDPENLYYARAPTFRLDAESIRDNALAISGLLTRKLGGPGVYPFQPSGVYEQIHSYTTEWKTSTGGDQFRRALYTWWKRTAPYPPMITFDAPRRDVCAERRPRTNTPLQALVTLNDPVFVQCAAGLAHRMCEDLDGDVENRVRHGFRLCVARTPSPQELDHLVQLYRENLDYYQKHPAAAGIIDGIALPGKNAGKQPAAEFAAMTVVGNVLLNLDETLTRY